jgi:protein phosphatase
LFREGKLHRLTVDHTLAQQMVEGQMITQEEAAGSRFSHVLVNAVGGGTDKLDVELRHLELRSGDQLLLCTDGLYDMVADEAIATALSDTHSLVAQVVMGLVTAANAAGGRDNVTAVLARF